MNKRFLWFLVYKKPRKRRLLLKDTRKVFQPDGVFVKISDANFHSLMPNAVLRVVNGAKLWHVSGSDESSDIILLFQRCELWEARLWETTQRRSKMKGGDIFASYKHITEVLGNFVSNVNSSCEMQWLICVIFHDYTKVGPRLVSLVNKQQLKIFRCRPSDKL